MKTQVRIIQRSLFPVVLVSVVLGAASSPPDLAPLLPLFAAVASLAVVLLAERWLPRVGRPAEPAETRTDLAYVGLTSVLDSVVRSTLVGAVVALAAVLPLRLLAGLPVWLGVPGVLLVAGFGDYWAHRFGHEWPWWWRMHAVHHAPHRMVALNNFRLHPLDLTLKIAFAATPVLLLGFSAEAIALAGVVKSVAVAFQHADVDLRHGPLNYLFATNSVHRWHHSAREAEANSNYGGVLSLFDLVFGTYRVPPEEQEPERMGLFDEKRYPIHTVVRATAAPWCWGRCVEDGPAADRG